MPRRTPPLAGLTKGPCPIARRLALLLTCAALPLGPARAKPPQIAIREIKIATVPADLVPHSIAVSPDGRHWAVAVRRGTPPKMPPKMLVIADGKAQAPHDGVRAVGFGPAGQLAYEAIDGKTERVVIDGVLGAAFDGIGAASGIVFGDGGKEAAYVGKRGPAQVVVRGTREWSFDQVEGKSLVWSQGGKHLAWIAQRGKKWGAFVDGESVSDKFEDVGADAGVAVTADGKRVAFAAVRGGKQLLVANGVEGKPEDAIGRIAWSDDGQHLACATATGPTTAVKWHIILDGNAGPPFDAIAPARRWSTDGRHFAYVATREKKQLVVFDGAEGHAYDAIADESLTLSPDGRHLAYAAKAGRGFTMIVDGEAIGVYAGIGRHTPLLSPDGALTAWEGRRKKEHFLVIGGAESPAFDDFPDGARPIFDGPKKLHATIVRGADLTRMEITVRD